MTIQQVLQAYLAQLTQQQTQYQQDITNLIALINTNTEAITAVNAWLVANPG